MFARVNRRAVRQRWHTESASELLSTKLLSKLQGQICCTSLLQAQASWCVLKFACRVGFITTSSHICSNRVVSSFSSLVVSFVCTGWGTYPGACCRSALPEEALSYVLVGVLTWERVAGACCGSKLPRVYRP